MSWGWEQWQFQSGQVTRAGDTHARGMLMGGKKNLVPPPNRRALDWSVVLTVGIGAWARLDHVAFDAQLQKAYFVTTLYDIIMYVCV